MVKIEYDNFENRNSGSHIYNANQLIEKYV